MVTTQASAASESLEKTDKGAALIGRYDREIPKWRWIAVVSLVSWIAWMTVQFVPIHASMPIHLQKVSVTGPTDLVAEYNMALQTVARKNAYIDLMVIGTCFGASGFLLGQRLRFVAGFANVLCGTLCGIFAAYLAIRFGDYLNFEFRIPWVSEQNRTLVSESILFAVGSVLLTVPFVVAQRLHGSAVQKRRAALGLLAGLLVGAFLPLTVSAFFPLERTDRFPPHGMTIGTFWCSFMALSVCGVFLYFGRNAKAKQ